MITKSSRRAQAENAKRGKLNDMSKEGAIKERAGQICDEIFCIPALRHGCHYGLITLLPLCVCSGIRKWNMTDKDDGMYSANLHVL